MISLFVVSKLLFLPYPGMEKVFMMHDPIPTLLDTHLPCNLDLPSRSSLIDGTTRYIACVVVIKERIAANTSGWLICQTGWWTNQSKHKLFPKGKRPYLLESPSLPLDILIRIPTPSLQGINQVIGLFKLDCQGGKGLLGGSLPY